MTTELKPCPFCNGRAVPKIKTGTARSSIPGYRPTYFRGYVKCTGCGVTTPAAKSPTAMVEAWNRRHG